VTRRHSSSRAVAMEESSAGLADILRSWHRYRHGPTRPGPTRCRSSPPGFPAPPPVGVIPAVR
jgi:hypothetical protein